MSTVTESQIQSLKHLLAQREHQLRTAIQEGAVRSVEEQFEDMAGSVGDEGDQSVADMLTDLGNAVVGHQIAELREIEAARDRIAEGTYGECIDCGEEIGYRRLQVLPTAKRCTLCQSQRERTYAEEPRSRL